MTPGIPVEIRVLSTPRPNGPSVRRPMVSRSGASKTLSAPTGVRVRCLVGGGRREADRDARSCSGGHPVGSGCATDRYRSGSGKRTRRDDDGDGRHHDGSGDHRAPQTLDSLLHQKIPFITQSSALPAGRAECRALRRDCQCDLGLRRQASLPENLRHDDKRRCAQKSTPLELPPSPTAVDTAPDPLPGTDAGGSRWAVRPAMIMPRGRHARWLAPSCQYRLPE